MMLVLLIAVLGSAEIMLRIRGIARPTIPVSKEMRARLGWIAVRAGATFGGILTISSCTLWSMHGEIDANPNRVAARDFLLSEAQPDPRTYAYGYLLFTHRPVNKSESNRYLAVCNAYIARFERMEAYKPELIHSVMPTYWLLREGSARKDSLECPALVKFYDYARAHVIAAEFGVSAIDGPVLVARGGALQQRATEYRDTQRLLTYDLSRYVDEDMSRAFGIWSAQVGQDPDRWRNGFYLIEFRESVRNLLQTSGAEVASVLAPESHAKELSTSGK